ncbi:hypothetical protein SCOCK_140004 [Actinacidiphila cocklensis]|uniref:Uncharacterized protein n=1 Tax=Actinacidiphila cocklensis TaxID=887465 RepID=A0A9W4DQS0_9ACTN|nr:hypothetical protein SCOCK_140004 [Actinacidiphila cocklensis]
MSCAPTTPHPAAPPRDRHRITRRQGLPAPVMQCEHLLDARAAVRGAASGRGTVPAMLRRVWRVGCDLHRHDRCT